MNKDTRISNNLPSHPKFKKLVRRHGDSVGMRLFLLFLWVSANRPDGDLSGMDNDDIEIAVDWHGEPDAFVNALVSVGFLDGVENEYLIHDWAEHNPWAAGAELRSSKARWNAIKKHHGIVEADKQVPEYAEIRPKTEKLPADEKAADSTPSSKLPAEHVAPNSPAPSQSPSPSPSPSQSQEQKPHSDSEPQAGLITPPTEAGRACLLMREAGSLRTSPGHPDLLAALREGITPETLAAYAANAPNHSFQYAIKVAREHHAANPTPLNEGKTSGTVKQNHRLSVAERIQLANERAEQRELEEQQSRARTIEHDASTLVEDGEYLPAAMG